MGRIANAPHRENQFRIARVGLELASQACNVNINDAKVSRPSGRIAPQLLKDSSPRNHMTWVAKQQFKKAEFGVGQGDAFGSPIHLAAIGVDH